jgi:hypothetical protein
MRVLLPLSKRSLPPFLVPKEDERAFPPYSSHFPAPGSSFHFLISLSFFFFFFRVFWKPNLLSTHYLFGFFSPTRHLLQSPTPPSPFSFLSLLFFFFFYIFWKPNLMSTQYLFSPTRRLISSTSYSPPSQHI